MLYCLIGNYSTIITKEDNTISIVAYLIVNATVIVDQSDSEKVYH